MKQTHLLLTLLVFLLNQNGYLAALSGSEPKNLNSKVFATINGIEYYISGPEETGNTKHATQFCTTFLGMSLASLDTKEKNIAVKDYLVSEGLGDEYFWTSGRRMIGWFHVYFLWSSTGFMMDYTDFFSSPIEDSEQVCISALGNSGWSEEHCTEVHRFICQKYV